MKEKLGKNEIEDITALTPLQEGIFFHYLKDRERDHYFEQLCLGITGDIDAVSFRKAWNFVVEANEMLRTVFRWEQLDQPTQVILKKHEVEIITYDFSDKGYCCEEQERLIEEVKFKDRKRKFNLMEVPFRILLFKIQPGKYEMIISNHHIVYDGWSNGIILKEFLEFYNDLKNGIQPVKPVKKKFKEFVKWSKSRDTGKEKKFWKEYLEGFTNKTELPIKKRKERSVKEIEDYPIKIGAVLKNKLETYSKSRKVTMSSILYTTWGLLLQKYTNDNDVIFGTTVSGRTAKIKGIDKIVGLFINTLPLRVKTNFREKIGQVVKRTSIHLQEREDFGYTSLTTIKDCSELENKDEFFDSLLVVDNYPLNELFLQNNSSLAIHKYSIFEMSHYDLTVSITLSGEIKIRFIYNNGILDREHLMYLSGHFSGILESIMDNPGVRISDVSILTKKEKELILIDFNSTDACYPKDKKINQLFEEQAAKSKIRDNIAIVFNDEMISYKELDERCNQLAEMLVEKGIRSGDIVGLLKERSLDLIIGIIGILKINGICLPLDVTYPDKRKSALLENSGAGFAIKGKECDYISNANCRVIDFDNQGIASYSKSKHVRKTADSEEGAFIFYTSGSTGKPKGIIITHTGTINNIYSKIKEMDLCRDDIFCQCLNISFAASVWQIFAPLVLASKFHIYPKDVIMDSYELFRRVDNDSITVLEVVPSMLNSYLELLKEKIKPPLNQLRVLLLTGEKIEPSLVNKFFKNYNLRLLNAYGQTEYTDDALYYEIPYNLETRIVPVGKPAINTQVYILDKYHCLQPLGIPGELFAAGDGLAKGYINDVETTSEKFTENPFNPGKKMYKTGDLARWLPDGNIRFSGRKDHQVKIRGFRIEPGEIESQLLDVRGIKEAVVTARTDNTGQKYLCAYVVSGKALEISKLRVLLSKTLPDYMVPSYFVQLDKMPLTSSGKIDRKKLPEPGLKAPDDYIAPGDEVETQLAEIWSEVLGVDQTIISIGSDFFQLGGHSLKAILLVSKINKVFHVRLPLQEIFQKPTLIELSEYVKNTVAKRREYGQSQGTNHIGGTIPRITDRKVFDLSYTQKSLWILTKIEPESSYNIPIVVEIKGKLNGKACQQALKYVIQRHDALRMVFIEKDRIPKQVIREEINFPWEYEDLSGLEPGLKEELIERQINRDLAKNFSLSSGPLIKGKLFKQEKEKHTLYLNIYHLICDGWSIGIIVKELSQIYDAVIRDREPGLPFLPVRYVDYVAFRNESIDKGKLNRRKDYWLSRLKEPLPLLDLPLDRPRPEEPLFKGASSSFCIEDPLGEKLKAFARQNNCSLFMVLLSAYFILLRHLTLCSDIIIGVPFAGRDDPILEDIVGFFVNTLPIRIHFDEIISLGHLITEVKKSCLEAYENSFPYSELVRLINPARRTHQSPIFSTIFNMHNIPMRMDFPGLEFQIREVKIFYAKFDIKLDMDTQEYNNRLTGRFEYDVTLFKKETIQHIIKKYDKVLKGIIQDPGRTIEDLLESIIDTTIFPSSFGVGRLEI